MIYIDTQRLNREGNLQVQTVSYSLQAQTITRIQGDSESRFDFLSLREDSESLEFTLDTHPVGFHLRLLQFVPDTTSGGMLFDEIIPAN